MPEKCHASLTRYLLEMLPFIFSSFSRKDIYSKSIVHVPLGHWMALTGQGVFQHKLYFSSLERLKSLFFQVLQVRGQSHSTTGKTFALPVTD